MDVNESAKAGEETAKKADLLKHTAKIATAYLSNNSVAPEAIAHVLTTIRDALLSIDPAATPAQAPAEKPVPAIAIKKSVTPDYIVCLEDGKKLKMLKRHLRTMYNMTPEEYRAKWGLPSDYPMVAPNYAERRSEFAKKIGLGKTRSAPPPAKPAGRRAKSAAGA